MANSMAIKKNNKRKFAALTLAAVGIAGLSVASAATLNLTAADEVAIGSDTFAACADSAGVDYTYVANAAAASGYAIDEVTVTVDSELCDGQNILVNFDDVDASAKGVLSGATFTSTLDSTVDIKTDLGDVTVIVG